MYKTITVQLYRRNVLPEMMLTNYPTEEERQEQLNELLTLLEPYGVELISNNEIIFDQGFKESYYQHTDTNIQVNTDIVKSNSPTCDFSEFTQYIIPDAVYKIGSIILGGTYQGSNGYMMKPNIEYENDPQSNQDHNQNRNSRGFGSKSGFKGLFGR